jgi:precorrin-6B methylase 2
LADTLQNKYPAVDVRCADFLACNGDLGTFDRIVMNPPFERGDDIRHIEHALTMLRPGGRLVALCANGPRQREAFQARADYWEDLPAGSFKQQGTGVNVALCVFNLTERRG